jgi:uncharacterized protein YuzE
MKIHYDTEVDALYIELLTLEPGTAESRELTEEIIADYSPDGKLAGLEILDASLVLGAQLQEVIVEESSEGVLHRFALVK